MRLAAVFIKEHFLFNEPKTINFGGKNIYSFDSIAGKQDEIEITKTENPDFIDGFWGNSISLVSAIVGENGAGKTSLLQNLKDHYEKVLILIYEDYKSDNIFYDNKTARCTFSFSSNHKENIKEDKKTNIYDELIFTNSKKIINENEVLSIIKSNREVSMFCDNIFLYDTTKIEIKIDSKNETDRKQFEKKLNFLSDKELTDVLNETFQRNINFYKKIKIKPIDYKSYLSKADELINNRIKTKHKESIGKFIFSSLSYKNDSNDFQKINTLILSKIILFKFEFFYNANKDCADLYLKFNEWLTNTKKVNSIQYNVESFIELIKEILSYNSENLDKIVYDEFLLFYNFIKENLEYDITKDKIDDILKIYEAHNNFNKLIDEKLATFYNGFLIFEPNMLISQGEEYLIKLFSNLYAVKSKPYQFIFLDEADLGFHPYWKKKFVNAIVKAIPIIFKDLKNPIQIIFTTHDPLTLSDIPNSNIVYLKKDGDKTKVLKGSERPQKSFGANITDLLADSFFFGNDDKALIGDFAKNKIQEVIKWLGDEEIKKEKFERMYPNGIYEIAETTEKVKNNKKQVIDLIDEPLLKYKLLEMYDNIFDGEIEIEREKKHLIKRAKELGLEIDYSKK